MSWDELFFNLLIWGLLLTIIAGVASFLGANWGRFGLGSFSCMVVGMAGLVWRNRGGLLG